MGFCWFTAFQEFDKQLIFPSSGIDNLNIQLLNTVTSLAQFSWNFIFIKLTAENSKTLVINSDFEQKKSISYISCKLTAEHSKYLSPLLSANSIPALGLITRLSSKSILFATNTPSINKKCQV